MMHIVIINPKAGYGKANEIFRTIQKDPLFKKENCRSFFTRQEGHAEKIAAQIAEIHHEHIKAVIVIGGDGTLHEVLNGLSQHSKIPVAVIPAGSGNDFARGIHLKLRGLHLFRKILKNPDHQHIYCGYYFLNGRHKYGRRYFLNNIGFGLDGAVVAIANQFVFRKWLRRFYLQRLLYPISLIRVVSRYNPITIELAVDKGRLIEENVTMVTIANHAYYGGGMKITPKANIRSSNFQLITISPISKWKLIGFFLTVFIGKHTIFKEVRVREASHIYVKSKQAIPFQVDGQGSQCYECEVGVSTAPRIFCRG